MSAAPTQGGLRRRAVVLAIIVLVLILATYTGSFFTLRKRLHITYFDGPSQTVYYFSDNDRLNAWLHDIYLPMHFRVGGDESELLDADLTGRSPIIYVRHLSTLRECGALD